MWVGEGLKEEIAGERGPRRPSQRRYDQKLSESFRAIPPAVLWFTYIKGLALYKLRYLGESKLDCSASSRANASKLRQHTARGYSCDMLEAQEHPTAGSYLISRFCDGLRRSATPVRHLLYGGLPCPFRALPVLLDGCLRCTSTIPIHHSHGPACLDAGRSCGWPARTHVLSTASHF